MYLSDAPQALPVSPPPSDQGDMVRAGGTDISVNDLVRNVFERLVNLETGTEDLKKQVKDLTSENETLNNKILKVSTQNRFLKSDKLKQQLMDRASCSCTWGSVYKTLGYASLVTIVGMPVAFLALAPAAERNFSDAYVAIKDFWLAENFPESQDHQEVKNMAESIFNRQCRYYAACAKALENDLPASNDEYGFNDGFWKYAVHPYMVKKSKEAFSKDLEEIDTYLSGRYRPRGCQSKLKEVQVPFLDLKRLDFTLVKFVEPMPFFNFRTQEFST